MTKISIPTRIFYNFLLCSIIGSLGMEGQKRHPLQKIDYHIYGIIFDYLIDPLPFSTINRHTYSHLPRKLTQLNERFYTEFANAHYLDRNEDDWGFIRDIQSVTMFLANVEWMLSLHGKYARLYPKTNTVYDDEFHHKKDMANVEFRTVTMFFEQWVPVFNQWLDRPIITAHRWQFVKALPFDLTNVIFTDQLCVMDRNHRNRFECMNGVLHFGDDAKHSMIEMKLPLYFMLTFTGVDEIILSDGSIHLISVDPTYLYLRAISANIIANETTVRFRFSHFYGRSSLMIETLGHIDICYDIMSGLYSVDIPGMEVTLQTLFDLKLSMPNRTFMVEMVVAMFHICYDKMDLKRKRMGEKGDDKKYNRF